MMLNGEEIDYYKLHPYREREKTTKETQADELMRQKYLSQPGMTPEKVEQILAKIKKHS